MAETHYPGWYLDAIVGFILLCSAGLTIIVLCIKPSRRRGTLRFWATTLLGLSFLAGSIDSFVTRQIAPRTSSIGIVTVEKITSGKNPQTHFKLQTIDNRYYRLSAATESSSLQNGEAISADWMNYTGEILHFKVLTGLHQGERFQNAVTFEAIISLPLGASLIFSAYRMRKTDPLGHPQKRYGQRMNPEQA